jgi:gluconate 2-dehydrogenase alpha chain
MAGYVTAKVVEIARAMGAKEVAPFAGLRSHDATRYQSTHVQWGAIMGSSPERSVVNPFLQHWQVSNLFVLGRIGVPTEYLCESHTHHPSSHLSHRRCRHGPLSKIT